MAEQTETKRKGIFELSTDTRILINVLERVFIQDRLPMVTYDELNKAIGRNVQEEARHLLQTARKHVQADHKILLDTVRKEGVRITNDYEGALDSVRIRAGRMIKRRAREVGNAIAEKSISAMIAAKISIIGAMELMSRSHVPKKLIQTIEERKLRELSTAETLKLFQ